MFSLYFCGVMAHFMQRLQKKFSTHYFSLVLILFFSAGGSLAQRVAAKDSLSRDSLSQQDSTQQKVDSTVIKNFLLTQHILKTQPYFNFSAKATPVQYAKKKKPAGKELYFYALAGLLLVFAIFRAAFGKYFVDMMQLFFRRSLKQRQLKQQVSQNSLPSLLFNIFYVVVAGFYIALLIKEVGSAQLPFWQLLLFCIGFVAATYILKFLVLKLAGWMFHFKDLTDSYIFIVFLFNKIIGIVLLPVVVIMALGNIELRTAILTLSWIAIAGLLIYRFIQAFGLLRKGKSISSFHFMLYLAAFEILPVLVIYKAIGHYL